MSTLPSFATILNSITTFFSRENLSKVSQLLDWNNIRQLADKVVNLHLPVAYTYLTYRIPALKQIGNYVLESTLFQTVKRAIVQRIKKTDSKKTDDKTEDEKTEVDLQSVQNAISGAREEIAETITSAGRKIIGTIAENTITGSIIKNILSGGEEKTESRIGDTSSSNEKEPLDRKDSNGKKKMSPVGTVPKIPVTPILSTKLADLGPGGWQETDRDHDRDHDKEIDWLGVDPDSDSFDETGFRSSDNESVRIASTRRLTGIADKAKTVSRVISFWEKQK